MIADRYRGVPPGVDGSAWFKRLLPRALPIRPKLTVAFATMASFTAICGVLGLVYVDRIGGNVTIFTDLTSPLLGETTALVENARRMRSAFLGATLGSDGLQDLPGRLADIDAESDRHSATLRGLAGKVGLALPFDAMDRSQHDYLDTLGRMTTAYMREQAATKRAAMRAHDLEETQQSLKDVIADIRTRADERIGATEREAKNNIRAGSASAYDIGRLLAEVTDESLPVVRGAGRLGQQLDRLDDVVDAARAQNGADAIQPLEGRARETLAACAAILSELAARLKDSSSRAGVASIQRAVYELTDALLGPNRFMAEQRAALVAREEVSQGRGALDQIDRSYLGLLKSVQGSVGRLNEDTRAHAGATIGEARDAILASIVLALVAGLTFGWLFARRITAPLRMLADHAVEIGGSRELRPVADGAVLARADEAGTLARAFNLMISELAVARQQMIDWSEAEIRRQFERLNAAINNMPQGLCMFDAHQNLIVCNSRYAEIYRLDPHHTVPGTPLRAVLEDHVVRGTSPDEAGDYVQRRLTAVVEHKPFYVVNELRDGHVIAVSHQPMADGGSVATHEDITERRRVEAKIAYLAHHDALTDLPNRVEFRREMEKALGLAGRGHSFAVMCIDLDHFKAVNDTLGHPVGDTLLQVVADRIRGCVRPSDAAARLGGDEFAVIQSGVEQPIDATALAARLIKELGEPYDIQGHQVVIGASIGIAVAPEDGADADGLLKNADMALYRAKEDGRGAYRFFEAAMDARMQVRRALELDLRHAVTAGEFEVFYQPVVTVEARALTGFEALVRWRHPQHGLILPGDFIPLSEEIGLINAIGAWVLNEACRQAAGWPATLRVAVNLSPVQFKSDTLVLDVVSALGRSGLAPHRLELEITEAVLLQDTEKTINTLNHLRGIGVRIAMDDFGTGYSSLGYLRRFPFDKIKIDRSFVSDLNDTADSMAIVRAVAGLGHTLGIATTAEGVESEEQFARLKDEGCTEVQGFLFSAARPASELGELIERLRGGTEAAA